MTIGRKLGIGFGIMMAITLVMAAGWLITAANAKQLFDVAAEKTARKILLAKDIEADTGDMLAGHRGLILYTYAKDAGGIDAARKLFHENADSMMKNLDEMAPLIVTAEDKESVQIMRRGAEQWKSAFGEIDRRCSAGEPDQAIQYANQNVLPITRMMAEHTEKIARHQVEFLERDRLAAARQDTQNSWIAVGLIALAVVAGSAVFLLTRQIGKTLSGIAEEMSQGAEQVASAAAQVSAASREVARGASEQAASLEETASASEEISSMTSHNAEQAQSAASLMRTASERVGHANQSLDQMVSSMSGIRTSGEKISKIIRVIDEIAFQTNILALNAAVEAARAGEAGMGFAVVADEVRSLAQRCSQAARDTAGLIEESITTSSEGGTRLNQVAEAIHALTETSTKVGGIVEEVSTGSQEQARGIEQVAKTVVQMQGVTQRTAASAEEGAAAAAQLSAQSDAMKNAVERLLGMVGAGKAA